MNVKGVNVKGVNVKGTVNEKIPVCEDLLLRERILKFAVEHKLVISEFTEHKILWSQHHGGRCFCSPIDRPECPCNYVYEDFIDYNGRCLCRVLWRPEIYILWKKQKVKYKPKVTCHSMPSHSIPCQTTSDQLIPAQTISNQYKIKTDKKQQKELRKKINNVWKGIK